MPNTSNTWRLLSSNLVKELMVGMYPNSVDTINKVKGKVITDVLCYVLNADINSAIYSKRKSTLLTQCIARKDLTRRELSDLVFIDNDTKVDWAQSGLFRIEDRRGVKTLVHVDGARVTLPDELQAHAWTVKNLSLIHI